MEDKSKSIASQWLRHCLPPAGLSRNLWGYMTMTHTDWVQRQRLPITHIKNTKFWVQMYTYRTYIRCLSPSNKLCIVITEVIIFPCKTVYLDSIIVTAIMHGCSYYSNVHKAAPLDHYSYHAKDIWLHTTEVWHKEYYYHKSFYVNRAIFSNIHPQSSLKKYSSCEVIYPSSNSKS